MDKLVNHPVYFVLLVLFGMPVNGYIFHSSPWVAVLLICFQIPWVLTRAMYCFKLNDK